MISSLASPSVCVIDEDEKEFPKILEALYGLHVGCIHFRGDTMDQLPEAGQPLKGLRLVFTDLYLSSGAVGKDMASHTANVFRRIVSPDTAPVVVIIWSKHVDDSALDISEPQDVQETEADLFKKTLLEAEPKYVGRLIFAKMRKPYETERPENWVAVLKKEIEETLQGQDAVHALWTWESLVREATLEVSEGLTSLSQPPSSQPKESGLKDTLQLLVRAQGESDLSVETAPRHLAAVLTQLLVDQLDHISGITKLLPHGNWLSKQEGNEGKDDLVPQLNSFLLTMAIPETTSSFMPGTVYGGIEDKDFHRLFGVKVGELAYQTFAKRQHAEDVTPENQMAIDKEDCKKWRKNAKPVLIEVSPSCDVAQGVRCSAFLIAGLILPSEMRVHAKKGDAFQTLPNFALRWELNGFQKQNVFMVFGSRYKVTLPATAPPDWLKPWFRLRELPTASLRNWHASHASRVGYVSL